MDKYAGIILAAGQGKRMAVEGEAPLPKVMVEIDNRPMVSYVIDLFRSAGIDNLTLVVGYRKEMVQSYFSDKVQYAIQEKQLGTGNAAKAARGLVEDKAENVIICYGDKPLYKPQTIQRLIAAFEAQKPTAMILTVDYSDPMFWAAGRIIKDDDGNVLEIVEQKDCNEEQLKIRECNCGFYIFKADWFWANIDKLKQNNAQGEYYLTDMVGIAGSQGEKVLSLKVEDEREPFGINTPEQLEQAKNVLKSRSDIIKN